MQAAGFGLVKALIYFLCGSNGSAVMGTILFQEDSVICYLLFWDLFKDSKSLKI